ncbi:MAG: acyl carrier protein [Chitinophagaceae bacterium]|nr:acyl carrier protein [Chitinophagaceae bacterium]MCA6511680.1 acyl carrier protein [Chitinophagaceae bacterium]
MKTKVLNILSEIRSEFDFSASSNFVEDGMLDSFDIVTLVTMLDEEFKISIEGTQVIPENFISVESICLLLSKYVKE